MCEQLRRELKERDHWPKISKLNRLLGATFTTLVAAGCDELEGDESWPAQRLGAGRAREGWHARLPSPVLVPSHTLVVQRPENPLPATVGARIRLLK